MRRNIKKLGAEFYHGLFFFIFGSITLFIIIPKTIKVLYNPLVADSRIVQDGRVMPTTYSILIMSCSFALMIQQIIRFKNDRVTKIAKFSINKFKKTTLVSIGYVLVCTGFVLFLPLIGFIPVTILCLFAFCWLYGYTNYKVIALISLVVSTSIYYILTKFLYISF